MKQLASSQIGVCDNFYDRQKKIRIFRSTFSPTMVISIFVSLSAGHTSMFTLFKLCMAMKV